MPDWWWIRSYSYMLHGVAMNWPVSGSTELQLRGAFYLFAMNNIPINAAAPLSALLLMDLYDAFLLLVPLGRQQLPPCGSNVNRTVYNCSW